MQQLRLFGLALFITAIFIALAAAITKTTHIRIQSESAAGELQPSRPSESIVMPPPNEPGFNVPQRDLNAVEFTSVPIVGPLIIAAGIGLTMWFMGTGVRRER